MSNLNEMLKKELIFTDVEASNSEEMIKILSSKMKGKGFVKDSYCQAVIDREKVFPTGLDTGEVKVSIPHTNPEHVNEAAILVATLKNPVKVNKMEDPASEMEANIVFMLAVKDPGQQVGTLGKLMSLFCKPEVLKKIYDSKSPEEIYSLILENVE